MKEKKPENITPVTGFGIGVRALVDDYSRKAHSESIKRGIRAARWKKAVRQKSSN